MPKSNNRNDSDPAHLALYMTYAVGVSSNRVQICGSQTNLTATDKSKEVGFLSSGVISQRESNTDLYESCYWIVRFSPDYDVEETQLGVEFKTIKNANIFIFEGSNRWNSTKVT